MLEIELRLSSAVWVCECVRVLHKDCIYDAVINYETIFINFHLLLDKAANEWKIWFFFFFMRSFFERARGFSILCFKIGSNNVGFAKCLTATSVSFVLK